MIEIPSLKPETRYGISPADRLLFNRRYIVGYSYLFRQPRWALELIDSSTKQMEDKELQRLDNFREDLRIPDMFQATLSAFRGSGFDRGHLISSADRLENALINSETFLLSNMSPQKPGFNRGVWKNLESDVRRLSQKKITVDGREVWKYAEVYAVCGPIFDIDKKIKVIGDAGEISIVIPHSFFKSVLAEQRNGRLEMWSFLFPNEKTDKSVKDFLTPTVEVEHRSGLTLWDRLQGSKIEKMKAKKGKMW